MQTKPATLGDRWQSVTIWFDYNANINFQCHRVTDANFAASDRQKIGYHNTMPTMLTDD